MQQLLSVTPKNPKETKIQYNLKFKRRSDLKPITTTYENATLLHYFINGDSKNDLLKKCIRIMLFRRSDLKPITTTYENRKTILK